MASTNKKPVQGVRDICDFCASPQVVTRYPCRDFDSESKDAGVVYPATRETPVPTNLVLASHDYWAACRECAALVDAENIAGLVERALREMAVDQPLRKQLEQHIGRTYKLFFRNRLDRKLSA